MKFGDLELLARIPPKVAGANLALAHARAGDCTAALELADQAFSQSLVKQLSNPLLFDPGWTVLNSIVRAFARCGAIERIEEAIADDDAGRRLLKRYLDQADSIIASSL